MEFPEFCCQPFGRHAISLFPSGTMKYFPEGETYEASFEQIRIAKHGAVRQTVQDEVFIHFVGNNKNIGVLHQFAQ